jgi:hypothetical protein
MSSTVGIKHGSNGKDEYVYERGGVLLEVFDGRPLWRYAAVSEDDGLITAALRQKDHPSDTQVVVIARTLLFTRRWCKATYGSLRSGHAPLEPNERSPVCRVVGTRQSSILVLGAQLEDRAPRLTDRGCE